MPNKNIIFSKDFNINIQCQNLNFISKKKLIKKVST